MDDGDHTPEANKMTLLNFLPYLKDDGVYVIEDVRLGIDSYIYKNTPRIVERHNRWLQDTAQYVNIIDMANIFGYDTKTYDLMAPAPFKTCEDRPKQRYLFTLRRRKK